LLQQEHLKDIQRNNTMEAIAKLNNCPLSPRKMRLIADQIRGMEVIKASGVLKHNDRQLYSLYMLKLLKSATSNWMNKNENSSPENLIIKLVKVDGGPMAKRLRTAPQGRAHRIRKRSNHITIVVDNKSMDNVNEKQA